MKIAKNTAIFSIFEKIPMWVYLLLGGSLLLVWFFISTVTCPSYMRKFRNGKSFCIACKRVTNQEYDAFVQQDKRFDGFVYPNEKPDEPAVWLSWNGARAYCQEKGGDLPTQQEIEIARQQSPQQIEGFDNVRPDWHLEYIIGPENKPYCFGLSSSTLLKDLDSQMPYGFRCVTHSLWDTWRNNSR